MEYEITGIAWRKFGFPPASRSRTLWFLTKLAARAQPVEPPPTEMVIFIYKLEI